MRTTLLLLLLLSCHSLRAQFEPISRHFGMAEGMPSNMVYDMIQDHQGFMWFCTDQGVTRFDGHHFENFGTEEGLPDNEILSMREDPWGRIWLMCYNKEPAFIQGGIVYTAKNSGMCKSINANFINYSQGFFNSDQKFCLAGNKVCCIDAGTISIKYSNEILTDGLSKHFQIKGVDYFLCRRKLYMGSGDKLKEIRMKLNGRYYDCESINDTVYIYDNISNKIKIHCIKIHEDSVIKPIGSITIPSWIYSLQLFKRELLCFTTDGVYNINLSLSRVSKYSTLPNTDHANKQLFDSEGNVWFSSLGSGVVFRPKNRTHRLLSRSPSTAFVSLTKDKVGNIWFTTTKNGIGMIGSSPNTMIIRTQGFRSSIIFARWMDNKRILVGSDIGLYVFNIRNKDAALINHDAQKAVYQSGNAYYLAGASSSSIYNKYDGRLYNFYIGRSTSIAKSINGDIMIGTNKGIIFFKRNREIYSNLFAAVKNYRITSIDINKDGNIAVGTDHNGAFLFLTANGQKSEWIQVVKEASCNRVKFDSSGTLWICSKNGLVRCLKQKGKYGEVEHYLRKIGLSDIAVKDIEFKSDTLICVTDESIILSLYNREDLKMANTPVYITNAEINKGGRKLSNLGSNILNYDENDVQVECTGISFCRDKILYKYIIKGVDRDTVVTPNNTILLADLAPGHYILNIWASDDGLDNWSSFPARISFTINPPFWKTYIFYSIILVFLGLFSYLIYRRRLARLQSLEVSKFSLKRRLLEMEMESLRSQINPHFLFNALNSIQNFFQKDNSNTDATLYSSIFSKLVRRSLSNYKENWISISDEIEMLTDYITIERMRSQNKFDYDITWKSENPANNYFIPRLLIQTYVENSIIHGFCNVSYKGNISIIFIEQTDHLLCIVEDNGIGIFSIQPDIERRQKSYGMKINRQRIYTLNLLHNFKIRTTIIDKKKCKSSSVSGTIIKISLPLLCTHHFQHM